VTEICRLSLLQSHDALVLSKNSLSMPKLLYTLRTLYCSDNTLLLLFDNTLRAALSVILNVDLNDDQWPLASLPIRNGGMGICSAQMLAPSAFLASAASTLELQQSILHPSIQTLQTNPQRQPNSLGLPCQEQSCIQKACDGPVSANHVTRNLSGTSSDPDKARLLAAPSPHTGDWLHAPPITSVGLRLSDEAVRVAVAHRLGYKACEPHTCVYVWQSSQCTRTRWPGLSQKWSKTSASQPA